MRFALRSSGLAVFIALAAPTIAAETERAAPLAATAEPAHPRRLWAGAATDVLGDPSPDGRYVSVVDPQSGDLAVREVSSGKLRRLTRKDPQRNAGEFAYFSVISPDGKRVAYAWFNEEKFYELRVVALSLAGEPAAPRTLYRNPQAGFVQPCAWSPDGTRILTLFFRQDNTSQIALVDARSGETRALKSLNWIYPKKMDFSPDGRFIVYDNLARSGSAQRDIFVLTADGSSETRLVEHPATDLFPLWSRGGNAVVFASDRGGTMGLWAVPVAAGKAAGEPRLLQGDLGRFLPMGLTPGGSYYYGLRAGDAAVYSGRMDLAGAKLEGMPQRMSGRFSGAHGSPAWSPDGNRLAYFSSRQAENYGQQQRAITIRNVQTDREYDLTPRLAHLERLDWSPDGKVLLIGGSDRRNRGGLYTVDAATGDTRTAVHDPAADFRGIEGVWSESAKSIYYVKHTGPASSQIREFRLNDGPDRLLYETNRGRIGRLSRSGGGTRLAFLRGHPSEPDAVLCSLRIAEGKLRRFVPVPAGAVGSINWSLGGERLLVGVSTASGSELWNIPVEGGNADKIKLPAAWNADLDLHPDGEQLAFTVGRTQTEVWVIPNLSTKLPAGI